MERKPRKKSTGAVAPKKPAQPRAKASSFQISAPEANGVAVVGEFNQWNPESHPLKKGKDGVWKGSLRLEPGTYQYQFVIDGVEWKADPHNPNRVATPYGSFNSVREVS